eukprot:CAMPEP_0119409812 /NCGR_PEP_ID=MMETSP1335-20130426/3007_1 /TAXON_ID=259385 /ORGANISM="Chrysoculter rhomboideus, Strain RCC1486" /LENGTH=144 /DNA_ID=CAMNT_0007434245 /DNA_START=333 /DNA_END=767 /DNA_ORIENTATION=-
MFAKSRRLPAGPSSARATSCELIRARKDTVEIRTRDSGSAWIAVTYGFDATCSIAVVDTEKVTTVAMRRARDVGDPLVLSSTTAGADANEKARFAMLHPLRICRMEAFGPSKMSFAGGFGALPTTFGGDAAATSARVESPRERR